MRRFADTARIPASPLWPLTVETAERIAAAWKKLEQAHLLPKQVRQQINMQILGASGRIK